METVKINITQENDMFWCDKCAIQIVGKRKFTPHNRNHEVFSCPTCNKDTEMSVSFSQYRSRRIREASSSTLL